MIPVDESDLDRFLSIAMPLLPTLWVILALQTRMLRSKVIEAHAAVELSDKNTCWAYARLWFWNWVIGACFITGATAEIWGGLATLLGADGYKWFASVLFVTSLTLSIMCAGWSLFDLIVLGTRSEGRALADVANRRNEETAQASTS